MKTRTALMVEAAEDASDVRAVEAFRLKLAAREEELIPSPIVDRFLDGEHPVKVWREYRGLTLQTLAEKTEIDEKFLSRIEEREQAGADEALSKIAVALNVTIDDLIGEPYDPPQRG